MDTTNFLAKGATIASSTKVLAKLGVVEIRNGHIGLLKENGDLIASDDIAHVTVKKSLLYFAVPMLNVMVSGNKYKINLSYQASIEAGLDDGAAKERQYADNDKFFAVVRELGGTA